MHYYQIALPVKIRKLFVYQSEKPVTKGCRVLVSFNKKLTSGYVWNEIAAEDLKAGINYQHIHEIIDSKPLMSSDLLQIAEWISNYYFCSLGIAINSTLPRACQPHIVQDVRLKKKESDIKSIVSTDESILMSSLDEQEWTTIESLRQILKQRPILKLIEDLENKEFIEVKRSFDAKIKPKYANFVTVKNNRPDTGLKPLTAKQEKAMNLIKSLGCDIPLAAIVDQVSYSVIKALKTKNLITVEPRIVKETVSVPESETPPKNITFTKEQSSAFEEISSSLNENKFQTYLLHGITGSGKTEIYIRLIKQCLAAGKTALVLVPEIALTPQMEDWFYSIFGDTIAIIHSRRNDRERWLEWKKIKDSSRKIVIGARSAVFAPLKNLGIIIVDEEHENSYKQDNSPRYNARDIAVLRAKLSQTTIVLGSATPSLESYNNVLKGKYRLLTLLNRPYDISSPVVKIVDLKDETPDTILSPILIQKVKERLEKKEQTLLLLNRRGYASYVICMNCGAVNRCSKCDVSLIYHSSSHQLMCHYCGHVETMKQKCPDCGSYVLNYGTAGTQQLEKQLSVLFPTANILRMDTDTTGTKNSYQSMFQRMRQGSVDILFGTQMIAKGLDFAKVTLVGVIAADNSLNVPDFRSSERTFQLVTQVSGRSGRGQFPGEVVIQTYNPEHYAIQTAQQQNYALFIDKELPLRDKMMYPPYCKIGRFIYSHKDLSALEQEMRVVKQIVSAVRKEYQVADFNNLSAKCELVDCSILGPLPAPIKKVNERYRFHIIIKCKRVDKLLQICRSIDRNTKLSKSTKVDIDIDPLSLL